MAQDPVRWRNSCFREASHGGHRGLEEEPTMYRKFLTVAAGALMLGASAFAAQAGTVAVSWKTFQEERWKTDEAAIKEVVEKAGHTYISTDAQGSAQKQAADIESLITQGCNVIMVVAFDSDAILPSFKAASDAGIKMLSYDVLVEDPNALYVTFDNVGVGRLMAKEILAVKPEGNYAFIKGDKGDPNATFLFSGITVETLELLFCACHSVFLIFPHGSLQV